MSAERVQLLPYVDIQHDALAVFDDVEQGTVAKEDIWVSGYRQGSESVHGKVSVEKREGGGSDIAVRGAIEIERVSKTNFLVSMPSLNITSLPVRFPRQTITPPFTKPTPTSQELVVNTLAYSDKAGQLVIGGPDGYCVVLSPSDPAAALPLKGHVGDVLHVQWFPSGEVVLTASSDLTLRIFSSKTGVNPRTLKGHTRAITATHILGIGRQVLSASKDGSVRLWDVGQGAEAKKWVVEGGKFVDGMVVVEDPAGLHALGVEEDHVSLAASPDGTITAFLVSSDSASAPLFTVPSPTSSKLLSIAYSPASQILATGHADGTIAFRSMASLVSEGTSPALVKRNEAPILSLEFDDTDLLVGTGSGLPARLALTVNDGIITAQGKEEYAGWEATAIETWAITPDSVWCAGGDSRITRY